MIDIAPIEMLTAGDEVELIAEVAILPVGEEMNEQLGPCEVAGHCGGTRPAALMGWVLMGSHGGHGHYWKTI